MKTSEQVKNIYAAIYALQIGLDPIKREKVVRTGKYEFRYAPLDAIMEKLRPLFQANGLGLIRR
jgi:hypothetical protein